MGQTYLIVGKMIINATGNDTMKIWVDPDLKSDSNIENHTAAFNSTTVDFASSLYNISVASYGSGDDGLVDVVYFSDTGTAYEDVTGVPEPATLALLGIGGIGVLIRRRRK